MDELRHQQQHNVIDPQHERLVEENCGSCPDHFPEASLSTVQFFNCMRDRRCLNVDELVVLVNYLSVCFYVVFSSLHVLKTAFSQAHGLSIRQRSYGAAGLSLASCF